MDGTAAVVLLPSADGPLINPTGKNIGRIASVGGERRPDPATAAAGMTASLDSIAQQLDSDGRKQIADQLETNAERTADWDARVARLLDGLSAHPADGAARSIAGAGRMADRLNLLGPRCGTGDPDSATRGPRLR